MSLAYRSVTHRSAILLGAILGVGATDSKAVPHVHLVKDINQAAAAGSTSNGDSDPSDFVEFNGHLVFAADDGVHGRELWETDGTDSGTKMIVDLVPGPGGSNPSHPFTANGSLYFFATDQNGRAQLLRLTADESSLSVMANDVQPTDCTQPVFLNGKVFFTANVLNAGSSAYTGGLWTTDGTYEGTYRLDLLTNADADPCGLLVYNNMLTYFSGNGAYTSIWTSDGTKQGTRPSFDGSVTPFLYAPQTTLVLDGAIYIGTAANSNGLGGVYRSDLTAAGTWQFLFDHEYRPYSGSFVVLLGVTNGHLIVSSSALSSGSALGVSDGSVQTDKTYVDLADNAVGPVLVTSSKTWFVKASADTGIEPWVTDGTSAGTHLLRDFVSGGDSTVSWFADYHGTTTLISLSTPTEGQQL